MFSVDMRARLEPMDSSVLVPEDHHYAWRSTGEHPRFRFRGRLLLPGWYILEVAIDHDRSMATSRLYVSAGRGSSEDEIVQMPVTSATVTKRLLFVRHPFASVRFDPIGSAGRFTVRHLRLVWLTPMRAHDRLARRLVGTHPAWRNVPRDEVVQRLRHASSEGPQSWRERALADYAETFVWRPARWTYYDWLYSKVRYSEEERGQLLNGMARRPLISVLLTAWDGQPKRLRECIESVRAQTYANWQLCVVDCSSGANETGAMLDALPDDEARIRTIRGNEAQGAGAVRNHGLAHVRGEYVALLDQNDTLDPDALFHVVSKIDEKPHAALLYSDEDKMDGEGVRHAPHFKPEWNPDLLLSHDYMADLRAIRTDAIQAVGGFREGVEGCQDYDLTLRCCARLQGDEIGHIPEVLYHRCSEPETTALGRRQERCRAEAGREVVEEYVRSHAPDAFVELGPLANTWRVVWPLPSPAPRVSLLVPTRDRVEILRPCVRAILDRTDYPDFELLILDNGSREREALAFLAKVDQDPRVRVLRWDWPFNYSAINNFGARHATGDILALVNNDVEPIGEGWLLELVRQAARPEIGCVGAKLYYSDGRIQHAGVILGIGGVAGHAHRFFPPDEDGYFGRLRLVHNVSAVTGACLVVRKSVFDEVGGLEEDGLPVAYNDVDFCLRVREAGYRNLFTPYALLYHYESVSRQADDTPAKKDRADREIRFMQERWGDRLRQDPAYNPNLSLTYEDFSLR